MKSRLTSSSSLALLFGMAMAFGLGLIGLSSAAHAQSTTTPSAAPATTVPPASTPTIPPAASTTAPPEVPAQGTVPAAPPRERHRHGSNAMNNYLTTLHDALKITPAEGPLWTTFADTMRDNAAELGQAYRTRREQLPTMNALQDMNSFITLEQQRLDGLKKSSAAFAALYATMSPDQQKLADTVFLSDMPGAPRHRAPKTAK
jgi:hypothetical protein